jgi:RNA polymerase sigma-70 factor (ECF subfamily)
VTDARAAVTEAFRNEWGSVVAHVIRVTGNWDLAEECAQDAFARALDRWGRDGIPSNPAGWLKSTARNRAYDRLRRETVGRNKLQEVAMANSQPEQHPPYEQDESGVEDDRLRLLFTCCHPAIAIDSQVALAMRTLLGLSTAEIARAFLVSEETMAKRLVRAKHKIQVAQIPYRVPPAHLLPDRLVGVLASIYGLFNEGYGASAGAELVRVGLCDEAIRLGRLLAQLMPDEPEALGLLALMILHNARRSARLGKDGELVPLEDQDRSLWKESAIDEGCAVLDRAIRLRQRGSYQLLAAIAACHATAATADETDWTEIVALYNELYRMNPTPVIALNQAVAIAMAEGPVSGLIRVEEIEAKGELSDYYLLPATRADLLRRRGRVREAQVAYRRALDMAPTEAERRFIERRVADLASNTLSRSVVRDTQRAKTDD